MNNFKFLFSERCERQFRSNGGQKIHVCDEGAAVNCPQCPYKGSISAVSKFYLYKLCDTKSRRLSNTYICNNYCQYTTR